MSLQLLLFYLERFAKLLNLRWIISCQVLGVSCIWSKLWCIMNLKMYWIKPFTKQILRLQYQQTLCWQTFSIYCFISCPRRTFFVLFIASHSAWACAFRKRISHLTFQIPNSDQPSFEATHQGTVCLKPLIMKHISKSLRKPEREKLTQLRCISKEPF